MQDKLIIGIDKSKEKDHICLIVGRKTRKGFETINEIYDDEAREIYKQLTGRKI